jgi:regulator of replication initiation timing
MPTDSTSKLFKSGRISFAASKEAGSKVNAESRIISDVILCQVGEAKGHGVHLEQSFIEAGIAYAQKHYSKIGMKCRFGHPAMSNDALGTEVGRYHNFKVVEDKMVADLHIYASANLSPTHPGAGDWILSMAEEDPNAIMTSIVFTVDHYYQKADGEDFEVEPDYSGYRPTWKSTSKKHEYNPNEPVYVALDELWGNDLVDEGAATDKLFSATVNPDKFAVIATQFLDEHPKIAEFLGKQPHKLQEFLSKYQSLKTNTEPMKIKFQKAWAFALAFFGLAETKEEDLPEVTAEHVEKLSAECTRLSDALGQAIKDKEDLSAQVEALGTDKTNLTAEVEKLTGQLAQETKDKAAYSALAEKYRAAAGDAFRETDPEKKTDELSGDQPKDKVTPVEESTVFKNAQKELANL